MRQVQTVRAETRSESGVPIFEEKFSSIAVCHGSACDGVLCVTQERNGAERSGAAEEGGKEKEQKCRREGRKEGRT